MPSDHPHLKAVLAALAGPIAELRVILDAGLARSQRVVTATERDAGAARARGELGRFGGDRIDAEGFARLGDRLQNPDRADAPSLPAIAVLQDALDQGEGLLVGEVPSGGNLASVLGATQAALRKAISAAGWSRQPVLPLVIEIDGTDLHAGSLAEFCDAGVKLVLLVRGPCAPAPLARLITPRTLVLQTSTPRGLERAVAYRGPAIAALVPEAAARFLHDPEKGSEPWQRIRLDHLPEPPRRALGSISVWQQTEELRHLTALARAPAAQEGSAPPNPSVSDTELVNRLAAWLLAPMESP